MIDWITNDDDLVLDFFAGSGSTGEAVVRANAKDGGRRRFILVQLPQPIANSKFRNICEITRDRLVSVGPRTSEEYPAFRGDAGFRVFKLDSSNIRAWEPDRDDLDQTLLDHQEHLKSDRSESDILYELLLKLGLDLCVPIERRTLAGKTVHSIGGGVLVACLATRITSEEVEPLAQGIVAWHEELAPAGDTTCVFRDSAFADDVAKTNLAAILHQHGIEKVRSL
jgi:adenine-specific DNA-methyltransferase